MLMERKMKLSDLQFENGKLVKIRGMRPEYFDGDTAIRSIKELGEIIGSLRHQLEEVTGTYAKYSAKQQHGCQDEQVS